MNARIERIRKRIEKEYVFEEAGDIVVSMQADLVWTLNQLVKREPRLDALKKIATIVKGSKAQMENQIDFARRTATEAIRKAKEN